MATIRVELAISQTDVNMARGDLDMAGVELDMHRVDLNLARAEVNMERVDSNLARVEVDTDHVDLNFPGIDLDTDRIDLNLLRVDLHTDRVHLNMVGVELDTARRDLNLAGVEPDTDRVDLNMTGVNLDMERVAGAAAYSPTAVRPMKLSSIVLAALFILLPTAANAELEITLAAGKAAVEDTDLEFSRPDGTDLTFSSVSWRDESFRTPLYWSLRVLWWRSPERGWGLGLDLTHPKAIAETNRVVLVQGRRAGVPVNGTERIADTLQHFELSHGLNTFTLNLLRRWSAGRLQPYVGVGAGVAVPHVEAVIGGDRTAEYQCAGPAFDGRLGLAMRLSEHLSAVTEYKLSYARVSADLEGGGAVDVEPRLHQWIAGLSVRP